MSQTYLYSHFYLVAHDHLLNIQIRKELATIDDGISKLTMFTPPCSLQ